MAHSSDQKHARRIEAITAGTFPPKRPAREVIMAVLSVRQKKKKTPLDQILVCIHYSSYLRMPERLLNTVLFSKAQFIHTI